jgi:two-component system, chemotaxis family, CheB/CheR fusion protein
VLTEELRPFMSAGESRFALEGEAVLLQPRAALAFGMIIHELTTNAVKYGALSVPDGRVELSWNILRQDRADQLICCWTERDGPQIERPQRRGFGLGLIERSTKYELEGEAISDWQPGGLAVTLKMPLGAIGGRGRASSEGM